MANSKKDTSLPQDYVKLPGSERRPAKGARLLGPAAADETFQVTIVLRRRTDGPAIPDFDYYAKTTPAKRPKLSEAEFAQKYGADPAEIKQIVQFAEGAGMKVTETHAGRRTVVVSGTVAQMNKAFAITLGKYEYTITKGTKIKPFPIKGTYRGRDGFINVPGDLAPLMVGVFGLDNRRVGHHSGVPGDPTTTNPITIQQMTQLYNFPNPGASIHNQTIGIIAPTGGSGGYLTSDLDLYFNSIGSATPNLYPISIDGFQNGNEQTSTSAVTNVGSNVMTFPSTAGPGFFVNSFGQVAVGANYYYFLITAITSPNTVTVVVYDFATQNFDLNQFPVVVPSGSTVYFNLDQETTQDICISGSAATGANIAVYFSDDTQSGWIDLIARAIIPNAGDFPAGVNHPSVLSASWSIAPGDDPSSLGDFGTGITQAGLTAMDLSFQDAAINGITVCIASGDRGCNPVGDTFAHVEPPASDPWILSVGGTTVGQYQPATPGSPMAWTEYVWNDSFFDGQVGATGGGVSDYFPLPSYQNGVGVPGSVNLTIQPGSAFNATGRGVPDVAGNASPNSGYEIYVGAQLATANGTSASTPLWAALIAIINSNLGFNVGFINPFLYGLGAGAFNPINPLWPDPAYPQLAGCPANNNFNNTQGYPAVAGWDACTGLGSPNGNAILHSFMSAGLPDVYILGGYQSPSVIITDLSTNLPVPIGGLPGGAWDTLLQPSTNYGFSAVVVNDSPVTANNVEVRFWSIPGGVALSGSLVGVPQTVSIPPFSSITVNASAYYLSAPPGQHQCAVVSLFNPSAGCMVQAIDASEIPDPGQNGAHGCAAWRNTDSTLIGAGGSFRFPFGIGRIHFPLDKGIIIQTQSIHIPHNWKLLTRVTELERTLKYIGVESSIPLYLLPEISRNFKRIHLPTIVSLREGGRIEKQEGSRWHLFPVGDKENTTFEIAGEIPKTARPGDIILLVITAHYPATKTSRARAVEFYEFMHVAEQRKK